MNVQRRHQLQCTSRFNRREVDTQGKACQIGGCSSGLWNEEIRGPLKSWSLDWTKIVDIADLRAEQCVHVREQWFLA